MAGRPKKGDGKSVSFAIYEKTWLILKDLEHQYIKKEGKSKPLKGIAHEAVEEYAEKRKNK